MTLKILRGFILTRKSFKFHRFFLRRILFGKYVKSARLENKKVSRLNISEYLIRKSFHFLINPWWLWSIFIQGNAFLFNFWKQSWKSVWKTDRKTPLPESIVTNLNFPKNDFHHSRLLANFLKVFWKSRFISLSSVPSRLCEIPHLTKDLFIISLFRDTFSQPSATHFVVSTLLSETGSLFSV